MVRYLSFHQKKNDMRLILVFCFSLLSISGVLAQHLGAYSDYRGHFFIFDRGQSLLAEDQQVSSFKVGGNCLLYINNQNNLKVYYQGKIKELEIGGVTDIYATDYLAAYSVYQKLIVIENGEPVILGHRCPVFQVEDSLIVFFDENRASLRIYYNGTVEDIENGLMGLPASYLQSSDNIVAYISTNRQDFKIYYKGELRTIIPHVERISYKAGKDIVAYINNLDNSFYAFYKGVTYLLEDFQPSSYRMGDGFVAYVDHTGSFKVFFRGEKHEISGFPPDSYIAEDNILLFSEDDYLKVFCEGKIHDVEAFIPGNFEMDWNTICYIDNTRRLWMFSGGEKKYLVNDAVEKFQVYRDLIVINLPMNRNLIWYEGKMYEGSSY
jgi:hypothetical protein